MTNEQVDTVLANLAGGIKVGDTVEMVKDYNNSCGGGYYRPLKGTRGTVVDTGMHLDARNPQEPARPTIYCRWDDTVEPFSGGWWVHCDQVRLVKKGNRASAA